MKLEPMSIETEHNTVDATHYVKEFVRGSRRRPRGILLAFRDENNNVYIGCSLCCKRDTFNEEAGLSLAMDRGVDWALGVESKHNGRVFRNVAGYITNWDNIPAGISFVPPPPDWEDCKIPESLIKPMAKFIVRVMHYYQEATFPEWCSKFMENFCRFHGKQPYSGPPISA